MTIQPSAVVFAVWRKSKLVAPLCFEMDSTDAAELLTNLAHAGLIDSGWMRGQLHRVERIEQDRRGRASAVALAQLKTQLDRWDRRVLRGSGLVDDWPSQHWPNPED